MARGSRARRGGRRRRRTRARRASLRRRLTGAAAVASCAALAWIWLVGCASPPEQPDDLCSIFREKRSWYRASVRSHERWGVPEPVQVAIIHQESSFRARARPPRRRILWIFPGPRPSSAYGYGQVIDATWRRYQQETGRGGADRHDFGDVCDFIGWYAQVIERRTGIPPNDAFRLYLAYHEGPGGYQRGSHRSKAWLTRAARQVQGRAHRYERQYAACAESLKSPWWWPF